MCPAGITVGTSPRRDHADRLDIPAVLQSCIHTPRPGATSHTVIKAAAAHSNALEDTPREVKSREVESRRKASRGQLGGCGGVLVAGPAVDWQAALGPFPLTVQTPERERVGRRFPRPCPSWSAASSGLQQVTAAHMLPMRCIARPIAWQTSDMLVERPSRHKRQHK